MYYRLPLENMQGALYPQGWRLGRDRDRDRDRPEGSGWSSASAAPRWEEGVIPKEALPVAMYDVSAVSFTELPPGPGPGPGPGQGAAVGFNYRVDFGRNF